MNKMSYFAYYHAKIIAFVFNNDLESNQSVLLPEVGSHYKRFSKVLFALSRLVLTDS